MLSGCSFTDRMSTFDPKGPLARMQLDLFWVTVWVNTFLFVTVGGALAYALIKFRAKPGDSDDDIPDQSHGNPLIEMGLIIFSIACLVIIAKPTLEGIWMMHDKDMVDPEQNEVLEVYVYGEQWWWAFDYPELGITTANELVIPKDRVVKLHLRSDNVIHSFWLPKIAGKTDLMPGRANWMWIKAEEEGHYYGQCAEYCGESHAYMLFRADVLSEADFDQWVADSQKPVLPPAREVWSQEEFYGEKLVGEPDPGKAWSAFAKTYAGDDSNRYATMDTDEAKIAHGAQVFYSKAGCVQCHAVQGHPVDTKIGPNLTRVGARKTLASGWMDNRLPADRGYDASADTIDPEKQLDNLYQWIAHSEDIKPGNLMYRTVQRNYENNDVTEEDIMHIAMWLQTLD